MNDNKRKKWNGWSNQNPSGSRKKRWFQYWMKVAHKIVLPSGRAQSRLLSSFPTILLSLLCGWCYYDMLLILTCYLMLDYWFGGRKLLHAYKLANKSSRVLPAKARLTQLRLERRRLKWVKWRGQVTSRRKGCKMLASFVCCCFTVITVCGQRLWESIMECAITKCLLWNLLLLSDWAHQKKMHVRFAIDVVAASAVAIDFEFWHWNRAALIWICGQNDSFVCRVTRPLFRSLARNGAVCRQFGWSLRNIALLHQMGFCMCGAISRHDEK